MIVCAVLVAAVVVAAAVVVLLERRRSSLAGLLAARLRRRTIVTLKSGDAFGGILFSADTESLILREAALLGAGDRGANLLVDGEVLILRGDVAYMQIP